MEEHVVRLCLILACVYALLQHSVQWSFINSYDETTMLSDLGAASAANQYC